MTATVCAAVLLSWCGSAQAEDDPHASATNSGSRLGVSPYQANKWGILGVGLVNPTDKDSRILVSTSVGKVKTNQYAREFWVPANSRRTAWHSILMPGEDPSRTQSIDFDTIVSIRDNGVERPLKTRTGANAEDGTLTFTSNHRPTAIILDLPERKKNGQRGELGEDVQLAVNSMIACQFSSQPYRKTLQMSRLFLPPVTAGWDGVQQVILAGDQLAEDAAAISAARRWLMRGGRIWIMLDLVKQDTVERLLGDGCPYDEVDRVGLTTLQIETPKGSHRPADSMPADHEQPVQFVRTLVTGVDVTHTINGWPAAFQQEYGRGKVLYTTAGMRAWVRRTQPGDNQYSQVGIKYVPMPTLKDLMNDFYGFQQPAVLAPELFDDYLSEQIGYEVVELNFVLVVLTTFCGGLLLAGMWLVHARRFRMLVWVGPVFAIAASGLLVVVGMQNLHSAPNTVATVQLVAVTPESDDLNVTGLLSVFRQESRKEQIAVVGGGMISPPPKSQPGTTRRMIWTDIDKWHWENEAVPAGVNRSTIRYGRKINKPIRAVGSFGPDGLNGRLDSQPFEQAGDAVLVTRSHHSLAVGIQGDGSFAAGSNEMLNRGEYIRGVLLSDEQRRRQDLYREMLASERKNKLIDKPMMFVWANPIETGYHIAADETFRGSALLAIPFRLNRTPPGQQVTIPGTFLPFRAVSGPKGFESSGHLNNADGTWLARSKPARTWLRAVIPPEVLPLQIDELTVTMQLSGKNLPVDIVELIDGKPRVLATRKNPVGIQRIKVDDTASLQIDESGGVTIGIFVGDTTLLNEINMPETLGEKWNIDFLQLEIAGTTLDETP
ncbi:MAG: hypothetical protein HOK71_09390 [Planctomycetaceae bacterium]|nr:hypothetical protein [Planctomycetaceae bacterium]MBT6484872.1 hypothetical protein [Planctomycetaceae bacterium]